MTDFIISFANMVLALCGRAYMVGGAVRDAVMGRPSHDHDIVVVGLSKERFCAAFPEAEQTGTLFSVFRLHLGNEEVEVALARKERKVSEGHSGFTMDFGPEVTLEEDLYRRDFTANAMARDILTGEIVDPFGGRKDIEAGILRAVSSHFAEDPLRVLRGARQAACFGFKVSPETIEQMRACSAELSTLPKERIFGELRKALAAPRPSIFFRVLQDCGALDVVFPLVGKLIGQTQPVKYHPEGDAFEHTMLVLDEVAKHTDSDVARFAALMHDVGKGSTPKELLPKHFGHDKEGARIIREELPSQVPVMWKRVAEFVAKNHMVAPQMKKEAKMVDVLNNGRRIPGALDALREVVLVDFGSMPKFLGAEVISDYFSRKVDVTGAADPKAAAKQQQVEFLREILR